MDTNKYSKFTPDEILELVCYVKKELSVLPQLKESGKRLTDYLIENTNISDFLKRNDTSDIKVILKSKNDSVNITDSFVIRKLIDLVKEETVNPFTQKIDKEYYKSTKKIKVLHGTGQGHTYPARKKGGQEGRTEHYIRQKVMRYLHSQYKERYFTTKGVYKFITDIFFIANHNPSNIKKTLDQGNVNTVK